MIFDVALILVTIGIFSTTWAVLEIVFLEIFLRARVKPNRSNSVRNEFDK